MLSCEICQKKSHKGNKVSHSHQRTRRRFKPNLHQVKVLSEGKLVKRILCSKCLKKIRQG